MADVLLHTAGKYGCRGPPQPHLVLSDGSYLPATITSHSINPYLLHSALENHLLVPYVPVLTGLTKNPSPSLPDLLTCTALHACCLALARNPISESNSLLSALRCTSLACTTEFARCPPLLAVPPPCLQCTITSHRAMWRPGCCLLFAVGAGGRDVDVLPANAGKGRALAFLLRRLRAAGWELGLVQVSAVFSPTDNCQPPKRQLSSTHN